MLAHLQGTAEELAAVDRVVACQPKAGEALCPKEGSVPLKRWMDGAPGAETYRSEDIDSAWPAVRIDVYHASGRLLGHWTGDTSWHPIDGEDHGIGQLDASIQLVGLG